MNTFNPIQFLKEISTSSSSGQLKITGDSVIWELSLIEGKLQSATHSLQSNETIKHYLLRLGHDAAKIEQMMSKDILGEHQPIKPIVNRLVTQSYLDSSQGKELFKELTQDALESLLWLTRAEYVWIHKNKILSAEETLLELLPLIQSLETKLQGWQKLNPVILSPHQRPYCVNLSLLEQPVPSGTFSIAMLKQLARLMKGVISIRQLALFLKQEDLKVAQLLFPYIQHKVLQLHPPKSPLDQLPQIPQPSATSTNIQPPSTREFSNQEKRETTRPENHETHKDLAISTQTLTPVKQTQKLFKITCIDDSPTMLDIIQTYLGTEQYEIQAIENPMQSLSSMFESKPDLILMDISMPGINGNRLCQILRSSSVFQQVPIIMVSGNTTILNDEKIRSAGATDYLAKPFTKGSLQAMVEKYLEGKI